MQIENVLNPRKPILGIALVITFCIPWWFGLYRIGELIYRNFNPV